MTDLLLPRTDAAVAVQAVVVAIALVAALVAFRRQPEVRILVIGLAVFAFGLMGVRALH